MLIQLFSSVKDSLKSVHRFMSYFAKTTDKHTDMCKTWQPAEIQYVCECVYQCEGGASQVKLGSES